MRRKNRKMDTSHKRCREYIKFKVIRPAILNEHDYQEGDIFTIGGMYKYGIYRTK